MIFKLFLTSLSLTSYVKTLSYSLTEILNKRIRVKTSLIYATTESEQNDNKWK